MLLKYVYILYLVSTTNSTLLIPISISYLYATYQSEKRRKKTGDFLMKWFECYKTMASNITRNRRPPCNPAEKNTGAGDYPLLLKPNKKLGLHNTRSHWTQVSSLPCTWSPEGKKQDAPAPTVISPVDRCFSCLHFGKTQAFEGLSLNQWWYGQAYPSRTPYFVWVRLCMWLQAESNWLRSLGRER